jgi:C-terminal processing protease CtpA/Prc
MKRFFLLLLAATATAIPALAAETNPAPNFREVYDLIRSHLSSMSDEELNRAAVEGLFTTLRGKVSLAGTEKKSSVTNDSELIIKAAVLEDDVAYVRVNRVADGLARDISKTWTSLGKTNKLKGIALDLRFTEGDDYAAAAAVADLFSAKERKLLDWGDGAAKSKEKSDAISQPVAVIVNRETVGAPEAVAAVLRELGAGLVLGNTTAGGAMTTKEFKLRNGQKLRIADSPVKLGDGSDIPPQGVKPDIEVAVNLLEERAYLADAYAIVSPTGDIIATTSMEATNRLRRLRTSEADLVRARREGLDLEELARNREPDKPLIRDPALARAVDVIKGLAVVRRSRS